MAPEETSTPEPAEPSPGSGSPAELADGVTAAVEWISSDVAIVTVTGEVDMLTAPRLQRDLDAALDKHPAMLVVDLTDVSFLGSAGLAALIALEQRSGESCRLHLVAPSAATRRPIQVTGLETTLAVFSTRDAALTDHRYQQRRLRYQ
jgi:anti-anti-sigma factor